MVLEAFPFARLVSLPRWAGLTQGQTIRLNVVNVLPPGRLSGTTRIQRIVTLTSRFPHEKNSPCGDPKLAHVLVPPQGPDFVS
jgi:hypothetical protein